MPYISKRHAQGIGLAELVELVQAESGCSAEAACNQIRDALVDGAAGPLRWDPPPPPSPYCRSIFGKQALAGGKPTDLPPPSPETYHDFKDVRDVSHWQDVKIDWKQGRVLDDFEHHIYRKHEGDLSYIMGWYPEGYPKPRNPEWRTLWLDRKACEQVWPIDAGSSKPTQISLRELGQWVKTYIDDHHAAGTSSSKNQIWEDFNKDQTVKGRASRDRLWGVYDPPPEWQKKGRPRG